MNLRISESNAVILINRLNDSFTLFNDERYLVHIVSNLE